MASYLIPILNVTSKLEGRQWAFDGGRVRWVGWRKRDEEPVTYGESRQTADGEWGHFDYRPGRLVIALDDGVGVDAAQAVGDALSGFIDLCSGPWGIQLTPVAVPDDVAAAAQIVAEEVEEALEQYAAQQPMHMSQTNEMYIGDDYVEWALDRLGFVLRYPAVGGGLVAASIFLFVSHLEFAFVGDDVPWVLGLDEGEDTPASAIDRVRVEESFHNCFKAVEALLGGEPPRDVHKLRARLLECGVDPDEAVAFPGHDKEAVIARIQRLQQTRDKHSAHGGRTGVQLRKITFFELMDAQHATRKAIYDSVQSGYKRATGATAGSATV